MSAKYWVAQVVEDIFRNEPRNVGVFVSYDGSFAAKFFGETDNEQVDRRKIKALSHPDVYRQWIEYWRNEMAHSPEMNALVRSSGPHYRVVPGGEVSDVGAGTAKDVAIYLYSLLVSEGGFAEALGGETEDAAVKLEKDVSQEFRLRNIFGEQTPQIQHPIRRGVALWGSHAIQHKPTFVQQNGVLWVMEPIDFTIRQKRRSIDHAGLSAYMFKDLREEQHNHPLPVEAIAIVKAGEEELDNPDVEYGLRLLENEGRIVNWLNENEKNAFIEERVQIARG